MEKDIDIVTEIWGPDVAHLKAKQQEETEQNYVQSGANAARANSENEQSDHSNGQFTCVWNDFSFMNCETHVP